MTYHSIPLTDILERQAHGVFKKKSPFRHNTLMDEADAMAAHGMEPEEWFNLTRASRNFMTSHLLTKRLMDAIEKHDQAEELKRKRKHHTPAPRRGRRR